MTLKDVLKILSTVPDNYEIGVWPEKFNRLSGQLLFGAYFKQDIAYTKYGMRDYLLPTKQVMEIAVYAVSPGFDEVQEWK